MGRGVATDLKMRVVPITSNVSDLVIEEATHNLRRDSGNSEWISAGPDHLNPGEENIEFKGAINVICEPQQDYDSEPSPRAFGQMTEWLSDRDKEEYRFKIFIEYLNISEEEFGEKEVVLDFVVPIKGATSFEEASQYGLLYEDYRDRFDPLSAPRHQMESNTGGYP